jgi:hypothetical protein
LGPENLFAEARKTKSHPKAATQLKSVDRGSGRYRSTLAADDTLIGHSSLLSFRFPQCFVFPLGIEHAHIAA